MFLSCARLVSFSKNASNFVRCFSMTKSVKAIEYLEGITRDPIMATSENTRTINQTKTSNTIPDHVWISKAKIDEFLSYFSGVVDEMEAKASIFSPLDNGKRIRKTMEYIMPGSIRFPGITAAESYKIMLPQHKHTPQNILMAYNLGWCLEIFVESVNIADDMMDASPSRRSRPCWHELPDVGQSAVNDAFMIHTGSYFLLRKHFGHLDCYLRLLEIFNESMFQACIGQHVDVDYAKNIDNLTVETFEEITTHVSTYLACYFPIAAAMTLAGYTDLTPLRKAKKVLTGVGYFYVIQNDINDCFGEESFTGKPGTDIKEGKCRWSNVVAMQLASSAQRSILEVNLGKDDPECVARVMNVYREMNLPKVYEEYSENLCNRLKENLNELDGDILKICEKLVESVIYAKNTGKLFFI